MSLEREEITKKTEDDCLASSDLGYEFRTQYRLIRRKLSAFMRYHLKKTFINVLYVTVDDIPEEYILSFQKQYPNKIIKVLTLHTPEFENKAILIDKFEYSIKNNLFSGEIYEYQIPDNNIQVYGISSDGFVNLKHKDEVYNINYLLHFTKCARIAAKKLKVDIIHSENIPFLLGEEFNRKNSSYKLFQTFHHYQIYSEIEPFWAAINLTDKNGIKRILKDNTIKRNLAALFGIKTPKGSTQIKNCLEYFYKNYEEFRNNVDREEIVNENILIKRLNDRIIKLFPQAFAKDSENFNPIFYTEKHSDFCAFNSKPNTNPEWMNKINILERRFTNSFKNNKVAFPVDINNCKESKDKNKKYLIKEFASERIQTKFTDLTLFNEDDIKVSGNLDIFYRGALILAIFGRESTEDEIKTTALSVLKCFEQRKNIQIIFNIPKDFNNKYFESLIEFIETQKTMTGKWLVIEGKINLEQFTSSADMILMPYGNIIGIENILYTSLKNGCIPVMLSNGICTESIEDIYTDMNVGCGFKVSRTEIEKADDTEPLSDSDLFTNTIFKALIFYKLNSAGWNRLVKNAISCDNSWSFELIEKYNTIYDEII